MVDTRVDARVVITGMGAITPLGETPEKILVPPFGGQVRYRPDDPL